MGGWTSATNTPRADDGGRIQPARPSSHYRRNELPPRRGTGVPSTNCGVRPFSRVCLDGCSHPWEAFRWIDSVFLKFSTAIRSDFLRSLLTHSRRFPFIFRRTPIIRLERLCRGSIVTIAQHQDLFAVRHVNICSHRRFLWHPVLGTSHPCLRRNFNP